MSKLGDIVAIPIALFALKALTGKIEDEEVEPILERLKITKLNRFK